MAYFINDTDHWCYERYSFDNFVVKQLDKQKKVFVRKEVVDIFLRKKRSYRSSSLYTDEVGITKIDMGYPFLKSKNRKYLLELKDSGSCVNFGVGYINKDLGEGTFSLQTIKEGQVLMYYPGIFKYDGSSFNRFTVPIVPPGIWDKAIVLDGFLHPFLAVKINHSCTENVYWEMFNIGTSASPSNALLVMASKDIAVGEEICANYKDPYFEASGSFCSCLKDKEPHIVE